MSYNSYNPKPFDRNPGFPPSRSSSPPQYPQQYTLWGSSNCYSRHAPVQPPRRNRWNNGPQYEQRFSVSSRSSNDYMSPTESQFQPAMRFSEEPPPVMAMHMPRPRFQFSSPTGTSQGDWTPFQPSVQYRRDAQFQMRTDPMLQQFPRSDEVRSRLPAYTNFSPYGGDQQPLISHQSQDSYGLRSYLQTDEHPRSLETLKRHGSWDHDEEVPQRPMPQTAPVRIRSPYLKPDEPSTPLKRDEHPRSSETFKRHGSWDYDEEVPQRPMPQTAPVRTRSPYLRPDEPSTPLKRDEHPRSLETLKRHGSWDYDEEVPQRPMPQTAPARPRSPYLNPDEPSTRLKRDEHARSSLIEASKAPSDIVTEEQKPVYNTEVIIERKSLFIYPDSDGIGLEEITDPSPEPQEQPNASSSPVEWTRDIFKREGAVSSQTRPLRLQSRGKKSKLLTDGMVKALSKPVVLEKGARMMQRMGWVGGGLGKDGSGIVDPIAPNDIYATTTLGFGQELASKKEDQINKTPKNRKIYVNAFKWNVLMHLHKFVTNDQLEEVYFDALLKNVERKRIHKIVEAIGDTNSKMNFGEYMRIVKDIRKCRFTLNTQSEGEGELRKICVFKEAPSDLFLVTPKDCMTDIIVVDEEPNPFLKSIEKHQEIASPSPPYLMNKLAEFFIKFSEDAEFKEFRFLGPFNPEEIIIINNFFELIEDLSKRNKPNFTIPLELTAAFEGDNVFEIEKDSKGYVSIKKYHFSTKEKDNV